MKFDQLTAHAEGKLLTGIVDRVGHVAVSYTHLRAHET